MEFWWNSTGIPSEYCRRFCPNLPHVFQNYSDEIPLIFWWKEPEFLWNFCGILMEFFWYFDGIPVKKAIQKVLLAEFNRYFCGIFHVFSHLAIFQKSMEKALHWRNLTSILIEIPLTCIANRNLCRKKPNYINEKHYIIKIF